MYFEFLGIFAENINLCILAENIDFGEKYEFWRKILQKYEFTHLSS